MRYQRPRITAIALAALIALLASGHAGAGDPEVTMEVIEDPHAEDLSRSHSLRLPSAAEARQGGQGKRAPDARQGKPQRARDAAQEAREHAREAGEARQDREQTLPGAARENRPANPGKP
jgi:hypothetical protein